MGDADELRELIDLIVERCREDGQLVTIHKHYPPAHAFFERGFFFAGGICALIFVALVCAKAIHWIGSLFA